MKIFKNSTSDVGFYGPGCIEFEENDNCQTVAFTAQYLIDLLKTYQSLGHEDLTMIVETNMPILICPIAIGDELEKIMHGLFLAPRVERELKV